jgi:hypothetical protein
METSGLAMIGLRPSFYEVLNPDCHPERSEGSAFRGGSTKQVLRFPQDDNTNVDGGTNMAS